MTVITILLYCFIGWPLQLFVMILVLVAAGLLTKLPFTFTIHPTGIYVENETYYTVYIENLQILPSALIGKFLCQKFMQHKGIKLGLANFIQRKFPHI